MSFFLCWYTLTPDMKRSLRGRIPASKRTAFFAHKSVVTHTMKIGVISDTHLYQVTDAFAAIYYRYLSDTDLILHAGDIVSPDVIDFLKQGNFHGVCGNMDPPEVKHFLPEKEVLILDRYRLGLIHGWGHADGLEDRIASQFQDVDIIVYGHSHRASNHVKKGVLFFNPGTATGYSASGVHSIGLLELTDTIQGEIVKI